jgi:hypothetical protein
MAAKMKRKKAVGAHQTVDATSPNSGDAARRSKLTLAALLAETPEESVDSVWEKMRPVGREFQ